MHIAFRTDASLQIGTGHVMRCLTLADALRARGAHATFMCRPHKGHLLDVIAQRGHRAVSLPALGAAYKPVATEPMHAAWLGTDWQQDAQDTHQALGSARADWLVVDHYALDRRWEQALRVNCPNLMVIDDLADRPHDCNLLLDQNLGRTASDYGGLLTPGIPALIGPKYALLRPEFSLLRHQSLARRGEPRLKRLLITMGGVDKDNSTGQVLQALSLCNLPTDLRITVVMGPHAPGLSAVQEQALKMPWPTQVLVGVSNMAELMTASDLCIGAAGSTAWERCCLGLPTVQLVLAENQKEAADAFMELKAAFTVKELTQLVDELKTLLEPVDWGQLSELSRRSAAICDGTGVHIVCNHLITHTH